MFRIVAPSNKLHKLNKLYILLERHLNVNCLIYFLFAPQVFEEK